MKIKASIFDLGGTIVDRYSITPLKSLIETFKLHNINIRNDLIFAMVFVSNNMDFHALAHVPIHNPSEQMPFLHLPYFQF